MSAQECAGCTTPTRGRWVRDLLGQWWCRACAALEATMTGVKR